MEKVIPWDTGGGNLHLSYTGQGNGEITIWSDSENYTGETRKKNIQINTTKGSSVIATLLVSQLSHKAYVSGDVLVLTNAIEATALDGDLSIIDSETYVLDQTLYI